MNKIYIMIGISGSGKSTAAKKLAETTGAVIVSRDALRNSIFGYSDENVHEYYKRPDFKECEERVTKFFNEQVRYALNKDLDVIADNTHLNKSYINAYKQFGALLLTYWNNVDVEEAIKRDRNRTRVVGEAVIRKQYNHFRNLITGNIEVEVTDFNKELLKIFDTCKKAEYDTNKKDCYVFDIDGTLAHTNGKRSPYDYSKVSVDDVDIDIQQVANGIQSGRRAVLFCSGREETCKDETLEWLKWTAGVPVDGLYMRKAGDARKDNIIKAELWREIQTKYNIVAMFDDRNRVVDMARKLGYKVLHVAEGDF